MYFLLKELSVRCKTLCHRGRFKSLLPCNLDHGFLNRLHSLHSWYLDLVVVYCGFPVFYPCNARCMIISILPKLFCHLWICLLRYKGTKIKHKQCVLLAIDAILHDCVRPSWTCKGVNGLSVLT